MSEPAENNGNENLKNTLNASTIIRKPAVIVTAALVLAALIAVGIFYAVKAAAYYNPLDPVQIEAVIDRNEKLPKDRRSVINAAVSIVGEVSYFWGGKSSAQGWDEDWGVPAVVESKGSKTTGTVRPMGLDCSGYVSWCFIQLGMSFHEMEEELGNGTSNQWDKSEEVPWEEIMPGDLAFQYTPGGDEGNHVGICIGFAENGEPMIAHCAASFNNVVVTTRGYVFHYARRPSYFKTTD